MGREDVGRQARRRACPASPATSGQIQAISRRARAISRLRPPRANIPAPPCPGAPPPPRSGSRSRRAARRALRVGGRRRSPASADASAATAQGSSRRRPSSPRSLCITAVALGIQHGDGAHVVLAHRVVDEPPQRRQVAREQGSDREHRQVAGDGQAPLRQLGLERRPHADRGEKARRQAEQQHDALDEQGELGAKAEVPRRHTTHDREPCASTRRLWYGAAWPGRSPCRYRLRVVLKNPRISALDISLRARGSPGRAASSARVIAVDDGGRHALARGEDPRRNGRVRPMTSGARDPPRGPSAGRRAGPGSGRRPRRRRRPCTDTANAMSSQHPPFTAFRSEFDVNAARLEQQLAATHFALDVRGPNITAPRRSCVGIGHAAVAAHDEHAPSEWSNRRASASAAGPRSSNRRDTGGRCAGSCSAKSTRAGGGRPPRARANSPARRASRCGPSPIFRYARSGWNFLNVELDVGAGPVVPSISQRAVAPETRSRHRMSSRPSPSKSPNPSMLAAFAAAGSRADCATPVPSMSHTRGAPVAARHTRSASPSPLRSPTSNEPRGGGLW